jgi:hypothetical protein
MGICGREKECKMGREDSSKYGIQFKDQIANSSAYCETVLKTSD